MGAKLNALLGVDEHVDLEALLSDLENSDIGKQIAALEQARDIVKTLTRKSVEALESSAYPEFVAERLASFGSIAIQPLELIFANSDDTEVKTHAALVLLQLHSKLGVAYLLSELVRGADYACLIARHLVRAEIAESSDAIIAYLKTSSLQNSGLTICLLELMNREKQKLPDDVRTRLANSSIAADILPLLGTQAADGG